jgi:hypothetical protein
MKNLPDNSGLNSKNGVVIRLNLFLQLNTGKNGNQFREGKFDLKSVYR